MRTLSLASLLLVVGCGAPTLSAEGARVVWADKDPPGCRVVGTVQHAEGGALRSQAQSMAFVEARLQNEAARLGGDTLVVTEELTGETDEGMEHFATGVSGLSTPSPRCSNCVLMTARAYACAAAANGAPEVEAPAAPERIILRP
jgi:hypothetical protein